MARVCVDSNYFNVDDSGQLTIKPGAIGFQSVVQVLGPLAPINFQIADYPNAAWVFVECVGGGGGGGGATDLTGTTGVAQGGGSGGGYCASWLEAASLPAIVPVAAGDGGSGGLGGPGSDGGDSTFGTLVVGPGGLGAPASMLPSATSGTGKGAASPPLGTGQIRRQGQPGGTAVLTSAFHKTGGDGGASGWPGAGGKGGANNESGGLGQTYAGGGGGGGAAFNSASAGGSGGLGIVRITIYS